ncbi:4a-hydroxytetrahydrobiopterin dehydratase [Streptomyces sp. Ncost-T10-10d]|uniref:4a-hydroxytetrahydrobiopterin dehydratase n=1 Tax=Streptomyces sp. Ncost-T10-10d TaxID=1839774 RepID=UPI00081E1F42|nr:4a-hydroxytetrahydrobiopterin dehydratase [Streptomyces sp. Ncost-T10-10d]SCF66773.1 pterin-4-alpha-carbinolamine dehydratase [Streptomyces sp. Ncost-T10-10d]
MAGVPKPLTDEEIEERLAEVPEWTRDGDEITRRVDIRYHAGVAMIVHIADRERRIGHHADIDLRIDHLRIAVTTHDADFRLTAADFDLAARIDAIAAAHQSTPLD